MFRVRFCKTGIETMLVACLLTGCYTQGGNTSTTPKEALTPHLVQETSIPNIIISSTPENLEEDIPIEKSNIACEGLDSTLSQWVTSDHPEVFAEEHNLIVETTGIGVEITLDGEIVSLDQYEITIRNQRGFILEAYVPLEFLCALSADPAVSRIEPMRKVQIP